MWWCGDGVDLCGWCGRCGYAEVGGELVCVGEGGHRETQDVYV